MATCDCLFDEHIRYWLGVLFEILLRYGMLDGLLTTTTCVNGGGQTHKH